MVREVADELYIKRVLMVLEDFLFFSLYSFSCIAKQQSDFETYSDLCSSIRTSSSVLQHPYYLRPTPPVTFGNEGIAQIFLHITLLSTTLIAKNTIYQKSNTDSELIDIANCKTCKSALLVVENAILIRYY